MAKNLTFPSVVVRRKRIVHNSDGSASLNVSSVEIDGQKIPAVTEYSISEGSQLRGVRKLTLTIVTSDVLFIDED